MQSNSDFAKTGTQVSWYQSLRQVDQLLIYKHLAVHNRNSGILVQNLYPSQLSSLPTTCTQPFLEKYLCQMIKLYEIVQILYKVFVRSLQYNVLIVLHIRHNLIKRNMTNKNSHTPWIIFKGYFKFHLLQLHCYYPGTGDNVYRQVEVSAHLFRVYTASHTCTGAGYCTRDCVPWYHWQV